MEAAAAGVQLGSLRPQIATQAEMSAEPESHAYEKCEYELVMERMLKINKICEAQAAGKLKGGAAIGVPLIPSTAKLG